MALARKSNLARAPALCALLLVSSSCTTEQAPLLVRVNHPASVEATESPLPVWTSRLPLDEAPHRDVVATPTSEVTPPAQKPEARPAGESGKQLYTCPMHAQIVRDEPGNCPICGMKLVPKKSDARKHGGRS